MLELWVRLWRLQKIQQMLVLADGGEEEDIVADDLVNKVLAKFGWDLEGVDAEREEDFDDGGEVASLFCFE